MAVRYEEVGPASAGLVHRLMREAFAEFDGVLDPPSGALEETVEDVRRAIEDGGAIVARVDGEPVAAARWALKPDRLYVGRVSVIPSHRRRGYAAAVMRRMEEVARRHGRDRIEVGVRVALPSNLELYRRLGYDIVSIQPHPRNPANDTATMVRELRAEG